MKSQDEISDEAIGYASHGDEKGNVNPEGYSEKQVGLLHGFIDGYQKCQEDNSNKKFTEEDLRKAIEKARDIFDGKDCFTAEDVSGCTEVCTYNWKFQFSEEAIIKSLNKQD
jgi:hypothetical protein